MFELWMFKTELVLEGYLMLMPEALRISFTHFILVNHKLPIERGCFKNVSRHEWKCTCSVCNELGEEFHFLFRCLDFRDNRRLLLGNFYCTHGNTVKYQALFSSHNNNNNNNNNNIIYSSNTLKIVPGAPQCVVQ